MESLILKANQWAEKVWKYAVQSWEERNQDHNYRDILARPGIFKALKSLKKIKNGIFLDMGCAEGVETFYIRDKLSQLENSGIMYGYDPENKFIKIAEDTNKPGAIIPITFGNNSIDQFLERYNLQKKVDIVTSIFVLQEIADIQKYLSDVGKVLNDNGIGIFLLVHPLFGEAMKNKNALKINKILNPLNTQTSWRFAGEYPIVEENGKTFFVPYFHRTIEDYKKYFGRYFKKIDFVELKPTKDKIKVCEIEHKSPFYNHIGNVYYPEIAKMKSSLIIVAKK